MSDAEKLARQRDEFTALDILCNENRRLKQTAVVDDDYSAVRHDYEYALGVFLRACVANGRRIEA